MTNQTTPIRSFTAKQHIESLIEDVGRLILAKEDFQAFIVLSIGIEFLGAFLDSFDFDDYGQSKSRFTNSLDTWFVLKWYKENKTWTYENLRGPLLHQYRPGREILLSSKCKNGVDEALHLTKKDGKTIFVLEVLFDHFTKAALKIDREMNKASSPFNKTKLQVKYLNIVTIEKWNKETIQFSGHSETITTIVEQK